VAAVTYTGAQLKEITPVAAKDQDQPNEKQRRVVCDSFELPDA
jgi:hypothetical protein